MKNILILLLVLCSYTAYSQNLCSHEISFGLYDSLTNKHTVNALIYNDAIIIFSDESVWPNAKIHLVNNSATAIIKDGGKIRVVSAKEISEIRLKNKQHGNLIISANISKTNKDKYRYLRVIGTSAGVLYQREYAEYWIDWKHAYLKHAYYAQKEDGTFQELTRKKELEPYFIRPATKTFILDATN